ncbi:MAG: HD domain-containing protein [Chloroflexi bacterium]|nr:HD domain-containing protein [Chloroflexota bacterium]
MTESVIFSVEIQQLLGVAARHLSASRSSGYVVGGAVRDALLGRAIVDVDIAVSGDPASLARAVEAQYGAPVVELDADRQVYRVPLERGRLTLDVTPLTDGSIDLDARRRDFTINALAVLIARAASGPAEVIDAVGGLDDLRKRQVRAVSEDVFRDDSVRLLRAVRIGVELGFTIEATTAECIKRDAPLLAGVAAERVRDEMCRILALPGSAPSLRLLDELRLLTVVLPELEAARNCGQPKEHYWDVLPHSIESAGHAEQVLRQTSPEPEVAAQTVWDEELALYFAEPVSSGHTRATLLKWAALLHDVGKPGAKTIEPDGRIRFLGHPTLGAEMTRVIMERLRFSNRETANVVSLVKEHLRPGLISRDAGPSRRALYRMFRDAEGVEIDLLFLSFADYLAARGPLREAEDWSRFSGSIRAMLANWRAQPEEGRPPKLVDGHDLMRELGIPPGPALGTVLDGVQEACAAGEVGNKEEALVLAARLWREARGANRE